LPEFFLIGVQARRYGKEGTNPRHDTLTAADRSEDKISQFSPVDRAAVGFGTSLGRLNTYEQRKSRMM
jgi:hypothetical protein